MTPDKNPSTGVRYTRNDRIDLNNYDRPDEPGSLKKYTEEKIEDVDRNLNEQMGGDDDSVTTEPNRI